MRFERQIDLKYGYQVSEITLPFAANLTAAEVRPALTKLFTEAHRQAFGYDRDDAIELVNLRLRALASAGPVRFADLVSRGTSTQQWLDSARTAYFGPGHGTLEAPIRRREQVTKEHSGPMVIEEPDTTVVVPPGWKVSRDTYGNLLLRR
jgi:N-methylhydantoinase A